ncbi:GPW/gp25 family protein [Flavisolibacter sp. BT320]|nr:GPW/gp25 family protein [Flavisolibacter longurius]
MSTPFGFIGRGWSFPPAFGLGSATVDMLTGEADINSSLEILFATTQGERILLAEYGCDLKPFLFEPLTTTMKTLIADRVKTAILYYEPRIKVDKVELLDDAELEGRIVIQIDYRVRTTNSRYNYVFDYYLNEGTEVLNAAPVNASR